MKQLMAVLFSLVILLGASTSIGGGDTGGLDKNAQKLAQLQIEFSVVVSEAENKLLYGNVLGLLPDSAAVAPE